MDGEPDLHIGAGNGLVVVYADKAESGGNSPPLFGFHTFTGLAGVYVG